MFIKIDHVQLEIEECLFCSNYPIICISLRLSFCYQSHQVIVILSLCFVKHIAVLAALHSFMRLITSRGIFSANYFSFEILLSKLTGVMTFSFLVIVLSF